MRGAAALVLLALLAAASGQQPAAEQAELLLSLPRACSANWEQATADKPGALWVLGTPPCGDNGAQPWKGVTCNEQGAVTDLAMGGVKIQCTALPPELALILTLERLDLKCNALVGGVPLRWRSAGAFPALQTLNLADNLLTGALSDFTPSPSGPVSMMAAQLFNVSRNRFEGGIPTGWRSPSLQVLDISLNLVHSTLPTVWAEPVAGQRSAFPSLRLLAVQGNNLTGPYAPWPAGGAVAFAPGFSIIARPGNGFLEGVPAFAASPTATDGGSGSGGGLSAGAIAGIAVGAVAGAALLALSVLLVVRRRRRCTVTTPASEGPSFKGASSSEWGKDLEGGGSGLARGSPVSPRESTWDSLAGSAKALSSPVSVAAAGAGGGAHSLLDGTLGSSADGEGCSTLRSSRGEGSQGGSQGGSRRGSGGRGDTDPGRLPSDWSTNIKIEELELSHVLGQGSFGSVHLAKYCHTTVAVKMLTGVERPAPPAAGACSASHARSSLLYQLEREASLMRDLRHTNVCMYMGAVLAPPCLVMEYCSRRSVDKLLAAGLRDARVARQLSWPRLLSMALDAARGMLYLHTRSPPVYHRDLKSANLLVTSSWQVKVADFNLSKALESSGVMSSVCIQNPRWLSPERLAGDCGGLSSDVWAFGTCIWELLSWEAPHGEANAYQIIHSVQGAALGSGLAPPPRDQLPAGPLGQYDNLCALMQACWRRDPAQRPGMEEVVSRLRAILTAELGRPLSTQPSTCGSGSMSRATAGSAAGQSYLPSAGSSGFFGTQAGGASPFCGATPFAGPSHSPATPCPAQAGQGASPAQLPAGASGEAPGALPADAAGAPSPFQAAAALAPAASLTGASPFMAAARLAPAISGADTPSPFAAAAARQISVSPGQLSRQLSSQQVPGAAQQVVQVVRSSRPVPQPAAVAEAAAEAVQPEPTAAAAQPVAGTAEERFDEGASGSREKEGEGAQAPGFDVLADSVLASFERMERVQRQLSRSVSAQAPAPDAPGC